MVGGLQIGVYFAETIQFFQQGVAVAVQCGNAASILGSAVFWDGSFIFSFLSWSYCYCI